MLRKDALIYVSGSTVSCAVIRGGEIKEVSHRPRNVQHDISEAIDSALELAPPRLDRVWIITPEVWSQAVSVPKNVVRRVTTNHLPQFLSFEAEPLSGIRPTEAKAAALELDADEEHRRFWVTLTESAAFFRVIDVVAQHGSRVGGLMHSAGAASSLDPLHKRKAGFRRLEIWSDTAVGITYGDDGKTTRRFFSADSVGPSAEARAWFLEGRGKRELLLGEGRVAPLELAKASTRTLALDHQDELESFLACWTRALTRKRAAPTINADRQPLPARTKRMLSLGLAACALLACIGHYRFLESSNKTEAATLAGRITAIMEPSDQFKSLQASTATLEAELKTDTENQGKLSKALDDYRARKVACKLRVLTFMRRLSEAGAEALVVDNIENDGDQMIVRGRSIHPQQVNLLVADLMKHLEPIGFRVHLPIRAAQLRRDDGGPHRFALIVRDVNDTREPPATIQLERPAQDNRPNQG